ncbi:MAG: sugar phosphate nucleotidyltransferase [Oscillospiraceae bacterium]|nr:sugar phosphate nucleotidyltransferase [Oscillospiraceae bacterium]
MKAVLLAGGEGTRLRPISADCPKPLVELFDKPVMEYGIELLKGHGFDDITVTLGTMAQQIKDYFGSGAKFGVSIRYSVEKTPLGTAGGVKAALPGETDEPILVLSGDGVTDFDLSAALARHNEKKADVTIILSRQKELLEYGLVMLDKNERVQGFIEKPSWGQVFSDAVNTGIYILSPNAMGMIPQGTPYDFARDLFPKMLKEGLHLLGFTAEGYWCDMGDSSAYLKCCHDILDKQITLNLPPQATAPEDVAVAPPCYIATDVRFGKNVTVGPYSVIGEGSILDDGAIAESCVIAGGILEKEARCQGAYIGKGAVLGTQSTALQGAVLGSGAYAGARSILTESARIWPKKKIAQGARVSGSVNRDSAYRDSLFNQGRIQGLSYTDISPDFCLRVGLAAGTAARDDAALSWHGGQAAKVLAGAIEVGLAAAGTRPLITDAQTPGCAGFCGGLYRIPLTIFINQKGSGITIYFFEKDGMPIRRELERKIESNVLRGDVQLADWQKIPDSKKTSGLPGLYAHTASKPPGWASAAAPPLDFSVPGTGQAPEILRMALTQAGCAANGGVLLQIDDDGLMLELDGKIKMPRLIAMMALAEALCGSQELALPCDAPASAEVTAREHGVRSVKRIGRDGQDARTLLASQAYMHDPICLAVRLSYALRKLGLTAGQLESKLPNFHFAEREILLDKDRGQVMRELLEQVDHAELYEGFHTKTSNGWVRVSPLADRSALSIAAEGMSQEAAQEICVEFEKKAHAADLKINP